MIFKNQVLKISPKGSEEVSNTTRKLIREPVALAELENVLKKLFRKAWIIVIRTQSISTRN